MDLHIQKVADRMDEKKGAGQLALMHLRPLSSFWGKVQIFALAKLPPKLRLKMMKEYYRLRS
jgi:hypothetical protein